MVTSSISLINGLCFDIQLRKNLEETIQSFRVTNEEMGDAAGSQDLQDCNSLCQVGSGGSSSPVLNVETAPHAVVSAEPAGEDAGSRFPLVQAAHGPAGVRRQLHRSRHQNPRLVCRSASAAVGHHIHASVSLVDFLALRMCVCVCLSESSTARHLQRSGVTAVSQQAWSKITIYTRQGFRYDSWRLSCSQQGFPVNTAHLGFLLLPL